MIAVFVIGYIRYPIGGYSNVGNNNLPEGCAAACANLNAKRAQVCAQRVAVATARAAMVAAGALYAAALAASLAAVAVAAVAAAIPFVGEVVLAAAATAAAVAAVYSNYLLGNYAAAVTAYGIQSQGLGDAMRLEGEALTLVNERCPLAEALSCVQSLPVCPV